MSTPLTPSAARRQTLVLLAAALVLCTLVACRRCGPSTTTPATPGDELQQLGQVVDDADLVLALAGVSCNFLPDPESCWSVVAGLEDLLVVAHGVVTTGEACRSAGDQVCLATALEQARLRLPELRWLANRVRGLSAPGSSASAAPSGSAG